MTTSTRVTATRTPVSGRLRRNLAALAQVVDPVLLDAIVADVTELETDAAYLLLERDSAWAHADQRLHEMTVADRAAFDKDEEERLFLARLWDGFTYDLPQIEAVVCDDAPAVTALATATGGERS
ncbi:hypothetical protein [Streptomyces sp. HUAS TT7]|uniref:hypothetical protein n=1 Tax=Streptomyces sp. HUAS TT7 TaxID=3447507 RepID=UPI003F660C2A